MSELYIQLEDCTNDISLCLSSLRVIRTALENKESMLYPQTLIEAIMLIESTLDNSCKQLEMIVDEIKVEE